MVTLLTWALASFVASAPQENVLVWDSLDDKASSAIKLVAGEDSKSIDSALKNGTLISLGTIDRFNILATDNFAQHKMFLEKIRSLKAISSHVNGSGTTNLNALSTEERASVSGLMGLSISGPPKLSGTEKICIMPTTSVTLEANGKKIKLQVVAMLDHDKVNELLANPVDWDSVDRMSAKSIANNSSSPLGYTYSFAFQNNTSTSFATRLELIGKATPFALAFVEQTAKDLRDSVRDLAKSISAEDYKAIEDQKLGKGTLDQLDPAWKSRLQDAFEANASKLGFDDVSKAAFWNSCRVSDAGINLYLAFGLKQKGNPTIINQFYLGKS